ncbi:MAG: DUF5723 family protein [Marinilabiliales bacterium]
MKKLIILSAVLLISVYVIGQQNTTLYFMHRVPQANIVNPSLQHDCKLNFGGLLIPIAGQVLPPLHYTFGTTGFSYKNVLVYDESIDSILHPLEPRFDRESFINKLRKVNYIYNELHINWLNAGYKWKDKHYFTFSVTDKVDFKFSIPKDLFLFAYDLNGKSFLGNTADFSGLGFSFTYYREWAGGYSYQLNEKLTIGGKAKLLFGKLNAWTKSNTLTWNTEENDFYYDIQGDWDICVTQPFYAVDEMYYDAENDSAVFTLDTLVDFDNYNPTELIFSGKNPGFALDLGVTYKLNDKINLYASLIDLGFIRWKDNVHTFKVDGELIHQGVDVTYALQENDSLTEEKLDAFKDSLVEIWYPTYQISNYTQYLTPSVYIGGTYVFNNWLTFGGLYRGSLFQHRYLSSLTLSGTFSPKKWFSGTATYTIINNSFANIGAGVVFKTGPVQFYLVSDNILGPVYPYSTRDINIRMGINLLFGCNAKNSEAMIN